MDRFQTRDGNDGHDRVARQTADRVIKILIASQDPATLDRAASAFTQQHGIQLTCETVAALALDADRISTHDLIILDADGMESCEANLGAYASLRPALICICDSNNLPACVKALSGTGHEILPKPFSSEALLDASENALRRSEQSLQMAAKYRKMRQLVRRVVRERRYINRRVELVCRDLVEAHRRLTYRFVELQKTHSTPAN